MNGYKERTTLQGNSFTNRIRANNMTRQCIIRDLNYCICKVLVAWLILTLGTRLGSIRCSQSAETSEAQLLVIIHGLRLSAVPYHTKNQHSSCFTEATRGK